MNSLFRYSIFIILISISYLSLGACKHRKAQKGHLARFGSNQEMDVASDMELPFKFITDLEGKKEGLLNNLDKLGLTLKDNQLFFKEGHTGLVFGGDASDRGTDSIKIRRWLSDLKRRYPDRVTLIWGNRDINKLSILLTLAQLNHSPFKLGFNEWVGKKFQVNSLHENAVQEYNTLENQLKFHFEQMGCPECLERHQEELKELRGPGAKVTIEEAAKDFVEALKPGGEIYEFLKLGQLAARQGSTMLVHGQVNPENFGIVPHTPRKHESVNEWIDALNNWGKSQLMSLEFYPYSRQPLDWTRTIDTINTLDLTSVRSLVKYSDANWDQKLEKVFSNEGSVVYGSRNKERDNFRLPSHDLIDRFKAQGISTLIVGHSPAGNIPITLRTGEFLQIMGDTSYSKTRESYVEFDSLGRVRLKGTNSQGEQVSSFLDPLTSPGHIGKVTRDGYNVVGKNENGDYVLFRYNGHEIIEKTLPADKLYKSQVIDPVFTQNEAKVTQRIDLLAFLEKRNAEILTLKNFDQEAYRGKRFLFISFDNQQVDMNTRPDLLIDWLNRSIDPNKVTLLIDQVSTNNNLIDSLSRSRFDFVSLLSESMLPSEIHPKVKKVMVMAENSPELLSNTMRFLKAEQGFSLLWGYNHFITPRMDQCELYNVPHRVVDINSNDLYNKLPEEVKFNEHQGLEQFTLSERIDLPPMKTTDAITKEYRKQRKYIITIDINGGIAEAIPGPYINAIQDVLRELNPKTMVINFTSNFHNGYLLAKDMGFETIRLLSPLIQQAEFSSTHVDKTYMISDPLEESKIGLDIGEYKEKQKKEKKKDWVPTRKSFQNEIEAIFNYAQGGREVVNIEVERSELRRQAYTYYQYRLDKLAPLKKIQHQILINIVLVDKNPNKPLTSKEVERLKSFYGLADLAGFSGILMLGSGEKQLNALTKGELDVESIVHLREGKVGDSKVMQKPRINTIPFTSILRKMGRIVPITPKVVSEGEKLDAGCKKLLINHLSNN